MSKRKELIAAIKLQYCAGTSAEKRMVFEWYVSFTDSYREHVIGTLNQTIKPTDDKPRDRAYVEAVKQSLVLPAKLVADCVASV